MERSFQWLQQKPYSSKHYHYLHPIISCIIHYLLVYLILFSIHDKLVLPLFLPEIKKTPYSITSTCCHETTKQIPRFFFVSKAFAIYVIFLFSIRLLSTRHSRILQNATIYEFTWLCNITLFMGAIALHTCRPLIASSFCVAVSIDQVLWYVDIAGYFAR